MGILLSNVWSHFHSTGDPQAKAIFMLTRFYLAPRVDIDFSQERIACKPPTPFIHYFYLISV
ncbi:hypothetical protein GFC30_3308 (plasmid) [Anoxybacillus amylolyticus]|uniref:Uncharacterized protein n=1 Tax=Anoxybacteroides amylolyticum TaxID=294699 RepID=A0A160F7R2_9BACL|nr:hypothetical protein GFC30_3308 [Anoxybacillus amylolyticus]